MNEYHVASFIVRCLPDHLLTICTAIEKLSGAQIHDHDPMGKIIVTAEGENHRQISNITDQIRDMANVADVAAVYHEYDSAAQAKGEQDELR